MSLVGKFLEIKLSSNNLIFITSNGKTFELCSCLFVKVLTEIYIYDKILYIITFITNIPKGVYIMPFTMFSLAMLLICILCIVKEAFNGFMRGSLRALMSLCAVVFSIICSIFVSRALGSVIAEALMENVVNDLIESNFEIVAEISSVYEIASFLIQMLANVIIFAIVFPILKWITNVIINIIIKRKLNKIGSSDSAESKSDKLWGAILGGICGIILATTVISPIMGTLRILDNTANMAEDIISSIPANEEIALPDLEPISEYSSDEVGNFCYKMGGELIYRHLTIVDFDGNSISAIDEISYIANAVESASGIVGEFSGDSDSFDFSKISDQTYESFEKSKILQSVALEVLPDFASAWIQGEEFLGFKLSNYGDDFSPMINELLLISSNVNEYNIMPTAKTLLDVIGVLIECDIRVDSSLDEIDYYLLTIKLYEVLEDNPNMESVKWRLESAASVAIADLVVANLSDSQRATITTTIASDTAQVLHDFTETQARIQALKEKLLERFEEYDLSVNSSLSQLFAYKLVKTAEENYDQILSSDVEALLNQTRGGMIN